MARGSIRFLRNGQPVELSDVGPNETVMDYLRLREGSCGTKEGCAEGDCGACTVAVGSLQSGELKYQAVNSCIQLLAMLDGKDLITVDDLADDDGTLHPVQQAMVDEHGSQCGFCTPGIVMSLFVHAHSGLPVNRLTLNDALAGNLCRCTGYRPIVDAGLKACQGPVQDDLVKRRERTTKCLQQLAGSGDVFIGDHGRFVAAPATEDQLAVLYDLNPDATLVAGATDVGLWITKQLRDLPKIILIGRISGFDDVSSVVGELVIGAGATYAKAGAALGEMDADIAEVMRRIGSVQVRAAGTIGGNIANGSPIGDMPPLLIALGAKLELRRGSAVRTLELEDFFIEYGKQDRQQGEFVSRIRIPHMRPGQVFRAYKISKRFDQDISSVMAAFRFTVSEGRIGSARISFGGMAGTPKRASGAELVIREADLSDPSTWQRAIDALAHDFAPMSDHRASADYRLSVAQGLLKKALIEVAGEKTASTRVTGQREVARERVA